MNQAPPADSVWGLAIAALILVLPLIAGAATQRSLGFRGTGVLALLSLVSVFPGVRIGDALWFAGFVVAGALLQSDRHQHRMAIRLAQGTIFLMAAEMFALAFLEPAPVFVDDPVSIFYWDTPYATHREYACDLIFNEEMPSEREAVLHLGDSLLVSIPNGEDRQRAPERLDAMDTRRHHLNLGVQRTSIDVQQRVAATWLTMVDAEVVVLWPFLNNDLFELGTALPCCAPYAGRADWCSSPDFSDYQDYRWSRTRRQAWLPTPIRVYTNFSAAAAHLRARLATWIQKADHPPLSETDARQRYTQGLDLLRQRCDAAGARLVMVHMPMQVQHAARYTEDRAWLADLARSREVPYTDLAAEEWDRSHFSADGWHLSQKGHARLAERTKSLFTGR